MLKKGRAMDIGHQAWVRQHGNWPWKRPIVSKEEKRGKEEELTAT
jgi:hypothetical protein